MMKAVVVTMRGTYYYDDYRDLKNDWDVVGLTDDLSNVRKNGGVCHCAELDNKPILKGLLGPMFDGGALRYESQAVYDMLSD